MTSVRIETEDDDNGTIEIYVESYGAGIPKVLHEAVARVLGAHDAAESSARLRPNDE